MTARPIESAPRLRGDVWWARLKLADESSISYQLDVLSSDVADVIRSAGGWLFDCAMGGWAVTAFMPQKCDPRPLHILGVRTLSIADWPGWDHRWPDALAVAADVMADNPLARNAVAAALHSGQTQVTVWEGEGPCGFGQHIDNAQHKLSNAAKAFKSQALAVAASAPGDSLDSFEGSGGGASPCPAPEII